MDQSIDTDVCVVGAGPAGSVTAESLARAGRQVVLLEQGPKYGLEVRAKLVELRQDRLLNELEVDFDSDWPKEFNSAKHVDKGKTEVYSHHTAGAGGMSLHWNGMTPRPTEDDYEVKTRYGYGRDTPVKYREMEPWLLRAEHALGVAGDDDNPYASPRSGPFPMPAHKPSELEREIFLPAIERLGWKGHSLPFAINSREYDGRPPCQRCRYCAACPSAARYSADRSHLLRFVAMPNGKLLTETKLLRLESAADGSRIVAAHCVRPDGDKVVVRAKQFVLAMGAMESTRYLFISGEHSSDRDGLGNAGGQLGATFNDHMSCAAMITLKRSAPHLYGYPTRTSDYTRAKTDRRELGAFFTGLWPGGASEGLDSIPFVRKRATQGDRLQLSTLRAELSRSMIIFGYVEMEGKGSRMAVDPKQVDSWKMALPIIDYTRSERDDRSLAAAHRSFDQIAEAMGATGIEHFPWSGFDSHVVGTAPMGRTPKDGVCDTDCRVFGKKNLFLATAAVLPHQGPANITLQIVALSLRLADHIARTT